jgi:trimeric autotransporter adhesin
MNHRRLCSIALLVLFVILGGCTVSRPSPTPSTGDDRCAAAEESCNRIEGFGGNAAAAGVAAATISGGGRVGFPHRVLADMGSIGGGIGNQAGELATVGGGSSNVASGIRSTIGGGARNTANRDSTTIAGGFGNIASGAHATVGGGNVNAALEVNATVGGGAGNIAGERHSTIGGGTSNIAQGFIATIAGGLGNHASGAYTTIGGGLENVASGLEATVGGGGGNMASAADSTIGGGLGNRVTDEYSTVSGGRSNVAGNGNGDPTDAVYVVIGGGADNLASGPYSVIPGGLANTAAAPYSFAAGRRANIGAAHAGAFLYADSSDFDFGSAAANEFAARATGGVRFVTAIDAVGNPSAGVRLAQGSGAWESLSDRNAKTGFAPVVGRQVLERMAQLSITTWSYKTQPSLIRHMGPTAQDFHAVFGLGEDDRYINSADADGVALAAIQGLYQVVLDKDAQIKAQQQRIEDMEAKLATQQDQLASLGARLSAIEKTMGTKDTTGALSAGLPGGWPILGGLCLLGLIAADRRRARH